MSGNSAGAQAAARTIATRYGEDFYGRIGSIGGTHSSNGGFASKKKGADGLTGKQRAKLAGAKGGKISKRPSKRGSDGRYK